MNPETAELVRQSLISIVPTLGIGIIVAVAIWAMVAAVREDVICARWRKLVNSTADGYDFTSGRARRLHPLAEKIVLTDCEKLQRAQLARDLVFGRAVARRWAILIFCAVSMGLGTVLFVVAAKLIPVAGGTGLPGPFAVATAAFLIALWFSLAMSPVLMQWSNGKMAVAAKSLADVLEHDKMNTSEQNETDTSEQDGKVASSTLARESYREKAKTRMKDAYASAEIPLPVIHIERHCYDADERWASHMRVAAWQLARAYSGEFIGARTEKVSLRFRVNAARAAVGVAVATLVLELVVAVRGGL